METQIKHTITFKDRAVLDKIFTFVCSYLDIDYEIAKSRTRKREYVTARHIFFYITRKYFWKSYSLSFIGSFLQRDHATVIHSCKTIESLMDSDRKFKTLIKEIEYEFVSKYLPLLDKKEYQIPKNKLQKERMYANNAIQRSNAMYYECVKFLSEFNRHINEDKIIEGFRRKKLDTKYWKSLKHLQELKLSVDTISLAIINKENTPN